MKTQSILFIFNASLTVRTSSSQIHSKFQLTIHIRNLKKSEFSNIFDRKLQEIQNSLCSTCVLNFTYSHTLIRNSQPFNLRNTEISKNLEIKTSIFFPDIVYFCIMQNKTINFVNALDVKMFYFWFNMLQKKCLRRNRSRSTDQIE